MISFERCFFYWRLNMKTMLDLWYRICKALSASFSVILWRFGPHCSHLLMVTCFQYTRSPDSHTSLHTQFSLGIVHAMRMYTTIHTSSIAITRDCVTMQKCVKLIQVRHVSGVACTVCSQEVMSGLLPCTYCPTLTKGSKWQITQVWKSDMFSLDLACSTVGTSL